MPSRRARAAAIASALTIVALAALLRLDGFVGKYGTLEHPAWARVATYDVAPVGSALGPDSIEWQRLPANPYVGGDPNNYLAYAREMDSFYQPHVREPVFLALVRLSLWALDGQDAGVSLASAVGSVAAVFATFLLGAALGSRAAGLLAALLLAMDYDAIAWASDGWRDDTFTATVAFSAWALVRLHQQATFGRAIAAGMLCGVACLTRITALTFVLPALLWVAATLPRDRSTAGLPRDRSTAGLPRDRRTAGLPYVALAAVLAAAVVSPYLASSAIATGDPFFAANYHTVYYRAAEGQDISAPMSAADYIRGKFAARPIATAETGFLGVFVQPFFTKWHGLQHWARGLTPLARWAGAVGLALLPFTREGRLLLLILLASLAPYAFTWNVGGGGEWRFTMHAYPIYLVAAGLALVGAVRAVRVARWTGGRVRLPAVVAWRAVALGLVLALGMALYTALPWFVVNEAIADGDSTSVETGDRDDVFYRDGWSEPHRDGIVARVTTDTRGSIYLPLPSRRSCEMVVRLDPVAPGVQQSFDALVNGHLVGRAQMQFNPQRVGSYRFTVPAAIVRDGENELELIPDRLVAARDAGPLFAWLEPDAQIGLRVWYVRVLP